MFVLMQLIETRVAQILWILSIFFEFASEMSFVKFNGKVMAK